MADTERANAALREVRRLFVDRYRIGPDTPSRGLDALDRAVNDGNVDAVRAVLRPFNLYPRHAALIDAQLDEADAALAGQSYEEMSVPELRALADERGVEVSPRATKADVITALETGATPVVTETTAAADGDGEGDASGQ